jgi:hypothetical protein
VLTATATVLSGTKTTTTSPAFAITPAAANAYRITAATTSPTAGVADQLTVKLADQFGNTVTSFTGDKSLTFSGLSNAGNGTHPTVTDKTGAAVNLGTATTITLTSGVSTAGGSLIAYKAETNTLAATDGTNSTSSTGGAGVSLGIANVAPVAGSVTYQRGRNVQLRFRISDLLTNATDANFDLLSLKGVATPTTQGATLATNATYVLYTPGTNGNVSDSFTYTVGDGTATSSGTVNVTIIPTPTGTNYNIVSYGLDTNSHPTMVFAGVPGFTYVVQVTTNLSGTPNWTDKLTTNAPTTGLFRFTDNSPPSPAFYRAINQ